jgi:hypothetical protein
MWNKLVLAIVGENFDFMDEIVSRGRQFSNCANLFVAQCGLVLSLKPLKNTLKLWNRTSTDEVMVRVCVGFGGL